LVRAVFATLRALQVFRFGVRPERLNLTDPHHLLVQIATQDTEAVGMAEETGTRPEIPAVDSAQATVGVTDLIDQVTYRGQPKAVVDNNSTESIGRFCIRKDFP
jgi:hypothetical protein